MTSKRKLQHLKQETRMDFFKKDCLIFKISLLFIYFGCAGSSLLHRAYASLRCICFSSPGARAPGAQASLVAAPGLVALQHVDSSPWISEQSHIPYIGRKILKRWTTREVLQWIFQRQVSRKGALVWEQVVGSKEGIVIV